MRARLTPLSRLLNRWGTTRGPLLTPRNRKRLTTAFTLGGVVSLIAYGAAGAAALTRQ